MTERSKNTISVKSQRLSLDGFTIVEVVIVVVIVAVIAAIAIVAYNGVQKKAAEGTVISDLRRISQRVEARGVTRGQIPSDIDDLIVTSPEVQVVFVTSGGTTSFYYSNLTDSQNGLLFLEHCKDLVSEGYGNGPNDFGSNTVGYITSCTVYDDHYLQINGWNGGFNISNPEVTKAMLQAYVDTAAAKHPLHPSYEATLQTFMDELIARFLSQGGKFPIVKFWKPWETAKVPVLPPPESQVANVDGFCLIATHARYSQISYVSTSGNITPRAGTTCD